MPSNEKEKHTRVVQISNISPSASREQIHHMFGYLGHVDEMKVYPSETNPLYASAQSKLCYIKYDESSAVAAAQHMTNTVFIDRALICVPVPESRIPDEEMAMKLGGPALPGQRQLPPNVINQIQLVGSQQVGGSRFGKELKLMVTIDPTLASLGLPDYPPLPANTDATKIEEIRRTIYVGNIPKDAKSDDLLEFFNDKIGEVMYLRMAGVEDLPVRYAYIEFTNQHSVPTAMQNSAIEFNGNKLRIQHSTVSIMKPKAKTQEMAKKEVEEAMKKTEAANPGGLTKAGVDPSEELLRRFAESRSPSRKRSRSRISDRYERKRSRSRSPSRKGSSRSSRRRSRTRSPLRPRSRSRETKRKSRSRSKKRSRSKDRKRSARRSRSRSETRRKVEKEKSSRDKDREKDKKEDKRDLDKSKERPKESSSSKDKKQSRSSDKDRKESLPSSSTSSKRRAGEKKSEEKHSTEERISFKEPDVIESKSETLKTSSKHDRVSLSSRRKESSSRSPKKTHEKIRKSRSRSPSTSRSELDTSKSSVTVSPLLSTSTITSDKLSVGVSAIVVKEEKTDEDSFVDELLEKTHVKKEKKKKDKKEKRKKKEKSSKRRKSSSEEDHVDSPGSFGDD